MRAGGDRDCISSQEERAVELANKNSFGTVLPFASVNKVSVEGPKCGGNVSNDVYDMITGLHLPLASTRRTTSVVTHEHKAMSDRTRTACGVPDDETGGVDEVTRLHPKRGDLIGATPRDCHSAMAITNGTKGYDEHEVEKTWVQTPANMKGISTRVSNGYDENENDDGHAVEERRHGGLEEDLPSRIRVDDKRGGRAPHPDMLVCKGNSSEGGSAAHWVTAGEYDEWAGASDESEHERVVLLTSVNEDEIEYHQEVDKDHDEDEEEKENDVVESNKGVSMIEDKENEEVCVVANIATKVVEKPWMTVNVIINGVEMTAIHDTGAEVSVIQSAWAKKTQLKIEKAELPSRILNPNGEEFRCDGVAVEKILIGGQPRRVTLVVVEDIDIPLILGQDFLQEHEVTLNCGQGAVWYGQELIPTLPVKKKSKKIYRATNGVGLALEEHLSLAKGQIAVVKCALLENTTRWSKGWTWIVEPFEKLERELGIAIPTALVEFRGDGKIFLGIANLSESTVTMQSGMVIARLRTLAQDVTVNSIKSTKESQDQQDMEVPTQPIDAERLSKFAETIDLKLKDNEMLDEKQKEDYKAMMLRHIDVLSAEKLGTVKNTVFDINVEGATPVRHKDRRWSQPELAIMKKEIETLTKMGLIEPADGEWASRLVMVTKKDGSTRVCVDFRAVNKLCKMDAYPSPSVEGTLDQLSGACWFTSFDAEKGYYQVAMTERAKEVSAFRCPFGYFRFTKMPFGMKNAGATFQRMMDMVLRGLSWKCCMVFVDDVVVYSRSWEEHLRDVDLVLTKFREFGITLNLKKCMLALNQLPFLGHIISPQGISPDPAKVKAVKDFIRPFSVVGLRSLLGMAGQLRKFVKNYALIVRPLNAMLANSKASAWKAGTVWTQVELEAFEKLKEALSDETILIHPDFEQPFMLWCDASVEGAGAVLTQHKDGDARPVAYASSVFNKAQRNYSTTQREGLAVVWAVAHYRPYIHGSPTIVVTDHSALTWILSLKEPSARLARWTMALMDYDLTFIHRPGKGNAIADALSRIKSREMGVDPEEVAQSIDPVVVGTVRSVMTPKTKLKTHGLGGADMDTWKKAQRTDPSWGPMIKFLEDDELPQDEKQARWISVRSDEFTILNGLLVKVKLTTKDGASDSDTVLVVPRTMSGRVMNRFHDDKAEGGHLGFTRSYAKIKEAYWWPRMYHDIKGWITSCVRCQSIGKTGTQKATIGGHVVGENPFDCIAMDLLAMPESWAGNKYVLVVMDYATRYAIAAPVKDKTAKTVAAALLQHVLLIHGPARRLLSDNGKEFKNVVVAELCRLTNMARVFTSPYHAQCDGMNTLSHKMLPLEVTFQIRNFLPYRNILPTDA